MVLVGGALWLAFAPALQSPTPTPQLPPAPSEPASPDAPPPPQPHVLAISWEPAFCEGASGKPECRTQTASRPDADRFSLHGLWPKEDYCDVAARDVSADKSGEWSSLPAPRLSAATAAALDVAMPGTQSGLERHEWIKHGTCSGAGADTYFRRAIALLDAVNGSAVRTLFSSNIGRSLTRGDIRTAFDSAFGSGAGARVRVACNRDGDRSLITELTIGLDGDVLGTGTLPALIAAARPTDGGCTSGLVDRVGQQ